MAIAEPADPGDSSRSASRRVAGAAGLLMGTILLSRVLALPRDAIISGRFGQGFESDVYYAAFILPDLLFFLVAGGALQSAFVPVFTEKLTRGEEAQATRVFSTVATVMFVLVSLFVLAGELFTAALARLTTGFEDARLNATVPLIRILLPAQVCFFLGSLMMGAQNARGRFLVPAMGPLIYNLGIIFGGAVLAVPLGVSGLCWGALAGALAGNFALQVWGMRQAGLGYHVSFDWRHPDVMQVWRLMLPVVLGLALPQVSILLNRMFASALGEGPISAITRANQLMQVPLGVFAQAMGIAIFPTLSAYAAQHRYAELRATACRGLRMLLFLTVPASGFMIALAVPIVRLLLEHGRFGPDDTRMTATALVFYSLGIFAWSAHAILARGFYSLQDTRTPVVIGTAVTAVFIPLNLVLVRTPLGYAGLALATTLAAVLHMGVLLMALRRRLDGFEGRRLAGSLARTAAAAGAGTLACWGAASLAGPAPSGPVQALKLHALCQVGLGLAAGIGAYAAAARLAGSDELAEVRGLVARRR